MSGNAAQAFDDLRAEVSVLRKSVERLPEDWRDAMPPDTSLDLGQVKRAINAIEQRLGEIEGRSVLRMSPAEFRVGIERVVSERLTGALSGIGVVEKELAGESEALRSALPQLRDAVRQKRLLGILFSVGLMVGVVAPVALLACMPVWVRQDLAIHSLPGTGISVGAGIMQRADPTFWDNVVDRYHFVDRHRDEIDLCKLVLTQEKESEHFCSFSYKKGESY
ncbi:MULTISPECIES: DUF6118 family protein [Asaia]|uniref:DUF6118 family protein n=1 Tax=Asaia TaxID=91914 RepID=UPI002556945B|nr:MULTISPECIES: DUF6118 family protein [Asaia]MDL2172506.1 DUF6118 family protein [Asaia sp. HumB]MDR6184072.1 hypothetical protein [Asaia bogorensis NBRC 16594]